MGIQLTEIAIAILVFVVMTIVGTGLVLDDFLRVFRFPRAVTVGTIGQTALVPAMAALIVTTVDIAPDTAIAILILALCPGGALSNFYCAIARQNVALSITLTAISSLVCIATIPVVGTGLIAISGGTLPLSAVPLRIVITQLVLFLIVPTTIGLLLRARFDDTMRRAQKSLHVIGLVLMIMVLLLATWEQRENLSRAFTMTAVPAVLFSIGALLLGHGIAVLCGVRDRIVIAIEFAVRNIPIAILLGTTLHQPQMVSFGLSYFLLHAPIVLAYSLLARKFTRPDTLSLGTAPDSSR